jgi:tRNA U34 5-carboxymethylaminomethyl modifying GTPase MnmE/TrmE
MSHDFRKPSSQSIDAAVRAAIEQSLLAAESLQGQVDEALRTICSSLHESPNLIEVPAVVQCLRTSILATQSEVAELFARQRDALGTVNIALFGRTGAGKSSLIEALSHGNGQTISTGECDFTIEVRSTDWASIKFLDTPGINGWGGKISRDVLEARTRKAVEVADIVVLCFDTSGQLESEFQKVAGWVKEYGKPVICVLNSKNAMWRCAGEVSLGSQRLQLSQTVREHVSNILTQLAAIGIHRAPIVAIAAQRAVYARTSEDYAGPVLEQFRIMREMLGCDELLRQSNLEVFEAVIVEALGNHAVEIRLGMLREQVRTLLERMARDLQQAKNESAAIAGDLDRAVKNLLNIVGYPTQGSAKRDALPKNNGGEDLLTVTEQLRGDTYASSAEGKAQRFARQRSDAELGTLRTNSIALANKEIDDCFDRGSDLDGEEFKLRVYDSLLIEAASKAVLEVVADYLQRELKLTIADAKLDMEFAVSGTSKVHGATGATRKNVGLAANIAGVLAGAAGVLAFTPEPIITKGIAAILGVAALALEWFGTKQRTEAKEERQKAKCDARANAHRHINTTYNDLAEQISASVDAMVTAAMTQVLAQPLANAAALWQFTTGAADASVGLDRLVQMRPVSIDAQGLIDSAAKKVALARADSQGGNDPAYVLLGEDWVHDPTGLVAAVGNAEPTRTRAYDPSFFTRMVSGWRGFVERFAGNVQRGAGGEWLSYTETLLASDALAVSSLAELRLTAAAAMPRYHLIGDYSSGKTSFIKRLLIDAGLPLPPTLEVRADPATDRSYTYEWEQALLVDSPGLQSRNMVHSHIALKSAADASTLICLFTPNLLVGSTEGLEQILRGDRTRGMAPKLDRTIFVIHRADALGPDPNLVPEQYVQICQRKKVELQQALASRGITVTADRIVCMAADPHEKVGDRRDVNASEFDRYREWDGFAEFHRAMRDIQTHCAGTGLDYSILDGGLFRLGGLEEEATKEAADLKQSAETFRRQKLILSDITQAGELLHGELIAGARRMVEDYAHALRQQAEATTTDRDLEPIAKSLSKWWALPDFEVTAQSWQEEAQTKIDRWWQTDAEQLNRTLDSPRFKAAAAGASHTLDTSGFAEPGPNWLNRALNLAAPPLKGATRDVVYAAGKVVGMKFRPWGAVKLAKNLGKVGIALGGALAVWDGINLFNSLKNEKKQEDNRKGIDKFIELTTAQVFSSITSGDEEAGGPLEGLRVLTEQLASIAKELGAELDTINMQNELLHARRHRYRTCIAAAWVALGQSPPTS